MLERYTHPTNARKLDALESFAVDGQNLGRTENVGQEKDGGRQEARTPDLRVANTEKTRDQMTHPTRLRREPCRFGHLYERACLCTVARGRAAPMGTFTGTRGSDAIVQRRLEMEKPNDISNAAIAPVVDCCCRWADLNRGVPDRTIES